MLVVLSAADGGVLPATKARAAVQFLLQSLGTVETVLFGPFVRAARGRSAERYVSLIHVSVAPPSAPEVAPDRVAEVETALRAALRLAGVADVEVEVSAAVPVDARTVA